MKFVRNAMVFAVAFAATLLVTERAKACAGVGLAYGAYTAPVVLTQSYVQPIVTTAIVTPTVQSQVLVSPVVIPVQTFVPTYSPFLAPVVVFEQFHGYHGHPAGPAPQAQGKAPVRGGKRGR